MDGSCWGELHVLMYRCVQNVSEMGIGKIVGTGDRV